MTPAHNKIWNLSLSTINLLSSLKKLNENLVVSKIEKMVTGHASMGFYLLPSDATETKPELVSVCNFGITIFCTSAQISRTSQNEKKLGCLFLHTRTPNSQTNPFHLKPSTWNIIQMN